MLFIGRSPLPDGKMSMKRDECLRVLAQHVRDDDIVDSLSSTTAFEWIAIRPNPLNYIMVGAMGLGSSHALGLRDRPARPSRHPARWRRQPA